MGDEIREHLKNLMEASKLPWTYGILWEYSHPQQVLKYQSGYFRGSGKPKEVRIMGSCVRVSTTEEVTDDESSSEWFFKISMAQSFRINQDLPGHAFRHVTPVWVNATDTDTDPMTSRMWKSWKRAKWAYEFRIQTFLCIPLMTVNVLELASTEIIPYQNQWIKDMAHFIRPIGTPVLLEYEHPVRPPPPRDELNEGVVNDMKDRGKEKISDSKCSWTLITESSDRGTDATFSCSHDYSGPS